MTNRMNIDMGDFFGGGGPAEQQPVKKEPKSKFGFGLLSRAKSITASPITPKKGSQQPDDFDMGADFSAPMEVRQAPAKTSPPISKPVSSATPQPQVTKPIAVPSVTPPKATAATSTASTLKPDPKSAHESLKAQASAPPASPVVLVTKSSLAKQELDGDAKQPNLSISPDHAKKEPPALPPRPSSPRGARGGDASPKQEHVKELTNDSLLKSADSVPTLDKSSSRSTNPEAVPDVKPVETKVDAPKPPPIAAAPTPETKSAVPVAEVKLTGPRADGSVASSKTSTAAAAKGPQMLVSVGKGNSATVDPVLASNPSDELRSSIAPWTVWAEDPDQTLANNELRNEIAPWTSQPDPVPEPPAKVERQSSSNGERDALAEQTIRMDRFFSNADEDLGDEEEFENPLLVETPKEDDGDEEMISKPSVTKKTWIGGAAPRAPEPVSSSPRAPVGRGTHPEKKGTESKGTKVIDYGAIFKAPVVDDDDENSFLNDPEFKDAPDFEW